MNKSTNTLLFRLGIPFFQKWVFKIVKKSFFDESFFYSSSCHLLQWHFIHLGIHIFSLSLSLYLFLPLFLFAFRYPSVFVSINLFQFVAICLFNCRYLSFSMCLYLFLSLFCLVCQGIILLGLCLSIIELSPKLLSQIILNLT